MYGSPPGKVLPELSARRPPSPKSASADPTLLGARQRLEVAAPATRALAGSHRYFLATPSYVGILNTKYSPAKKNTISGDHPASNGGSCPTPPIAARSSAPSQ